MTTSDSVASGVRYVLTEAGRTALSEAVECKCQIRLTGVLLACVECGTVYGSIREDRKSRPRRGARGWAR